MSDQEQLINQLGQIQEAIGRVERRFSTISTPGAFIKDDEGLDRLDAICMMLIAIGEAFKRIDRVTEGDLLANYSDIDWRGVIGVRDVIAHGYFDIDEEQVFSICQHDLPELGAVVKRMLSDLSCH